MISATLDTNVDLRAFDTGGAALQLLEYAKVGVIRIDLSQPILDYIVSETETCFGATRDPSLTVNALSHGMVDGALRFNRAVLLNQMTAMLPIQQNSPM